MCNGSQSIKSILLDEFFAIMMFLFLFYFCLLQIIIFSCSGPIKLCQAQFYKRKVTFPKKKYTVRVQQPWSYSKRKHIKVTVCFDCFDFGYLVLISYQWTNWGENKRNVLTFELYIVRITITYFYLQITNTCKYKAKCNCQKMGPGSLYKCALVHF